MKKPEDDIDGRTPIWNCLQDLFMDTDVSGSYPYIVSVCSQSQYSVAEIHDILFQEVLPALRFNLYALPAPQWMGFETSWLVKRILKKHQFGQRQPWFGRRYVQDEWLKLKPLIQEARNECS